MVSYTWLQCKRYDSLPAEITILRQQNNSSVYGESFYWTNSRSNRIIDFYYNIKVVIKTILLYNSLSLNRIVS